MQIKKVFLRSARALTQTAGRAARNIDGRVIFYADKITDSMQKTMDQTDHRRTKQIHYNELHGLSPKALLKSKEQIIEQSAIAGVGRKLSKAYIEPEMNSLAADPVIKYMSNTEIEKQIQDRRKQMEKAAKELDFIEAARYRDEIEEYKKQLRKK